MFSRLFCISALLSVTAFAQQVTLPLPRLLTVTPMGGQVGTEMEVTITGENLEEVTELTFSTPTITAKPVAGKENSFVVSIAKDAPPGVHDARVMSRLGVSSARAFSVNTLPEVVRTVANNSVETALKLPVNSICNATMTKRAVDFYSFEGVKGQRLAVDCASVGIDSKLTPVLIIADSEGRDLLVNRTGGVIEFTPPANATYLIKVNDLTYQGGSTHFYRLALQVLKGDGPPPRQALTQTVSGMSWPPPGLADAAEAAETEPNNHPGEAQKITLPCDIAGSFFPAADVDTFEFTAKKGETWWVEVASERLGLNTDPFVLVQSVTKSGDGEVLADVAELHDIASPVKVSTNGYSYDGPPYNVGSPDVNGKFEVKVDGTYRLQVRDLFGGTRNDPGNVYRLIVRQATPDFSLAAWSVHMTLRNGDRNALSKPLALRAGTSVAFEVLAIRRDGFDGEIELGMEGLPPGVSATGLRIPKGKSVGHVIISADGAAKSAFSIAKMYGRATVGETAVTRPCRVASMEWPSRNAKTDIPAPRLMADIPVSVTDSEGAPVTIAAAEDKVWKAKAGEKLKIPLKLTWRNDFTGTTLKLKAYGDGFTGLKEFEIPIKATSHEVELDLATLKVQPGDYTLAFYGIGVSKYRYNPAAVLLAEAEQKQVEAEAKAAAAKAKELAATDEAAAKKAAEKQKAAEAAMAEVAKRMKSVTAAAAPKDTVDIVVSQPIRISVEATEMAAK